MGRISVKISWSFILRDKQNNQQGKDQQMGNSIRFEDIEKKYGQSGVDYVAFRYHERKNYKKIKQLINNLKDQAKLQLNETLQFITQEQRLLGEQFSKAKTQAETQNPDTIKIAEAKFKQPVEDFSGYNLQLQKLKDLHQQVNKKYQTEMATMESRIRKQLIKKQNKSNLYTIKEFDDKSSNQRATIENQCIRAHPQKEKEDHIQGFETTYTWGNEKHPFDAFFEKEKTQIECKEARQKIRGSIVPAKTPVCC